MGLIFHGDFMKRDPAILPNGFHEGFPPEMETADFFPGSTNGEFDWIYCTADWDWKTPERWMVLTGKPSTNMFIMGFNGNIITGIGNDDCFLLVTDGI